MTISIIKILQNLISKGQKYLWIKKEWKFQVRLLTLLSCHTSMMPLFAVWWHPTDQFHTATSMTAKTHQELLEKAKRNWPAHLLKEVPPNATSIDYQSNSQTSHPALQSWSKFQPLLPAEKPRKFTLVPVSPEFMASWFFPPLQYLLKDLSSVTASGQLYCST